MFIKKFIAKNVHGYLNYDINFKDNLTFLVGINGSGKTSALKIILGLISPSYQYLSQVEFESAYILCSDGKEDIVIESIYNKEKRGFNLRANVGEKNIKTRFYKSIILNDIEEYDSDKLSFLRESQSSNFENEEVVRLIRSKVSPKFLGLDRKIYDGKKIDQSFYRERFISSYKKKNFVKQFSLTQIDNSLQDIQNLLFIYIRKISKEQLMYSEGFKSSVFRTSIKFNEQENLNTDLPLMKDFEEKEKIVSEAFDSLKLDFLQKEVFYFFAKMKRLIDKYHKINEEIDFIGADKIPEEMENRRFELMIKWLNNSSQLRNIDEIIEYSITYQTRMATIWQPIRRLEIIITDFLKEGNKKLIVEDDGELKVLLKNGNKTSIYDLSSGEKQIIIMIAHLIFDDELNESGIFIIDEPELSLHIAWQEIFVDSLLAANPDMQFIFATHSPSIVAKTEREKYCEDLNKLNF